MSELRTYSRPMPPAIAVCPVICVTRLPLGRSEIEA